MAQVKLLETGKDFNVFDLPFKKFAPILKDSNGTEITCSSAEMYRPEDIKYVYSGASISGVGDSCEVSLRAYKEDGKTVIQVYANTDQID